MKKRLLPIILCIALCLPFALTSCFVPDDGDKTGGETQSFFNEISLMSEFEKSYNAASVYQTEAEFQHFYENLALFTSTSLSLDNAKSTTKYEIVDVTTGVVVYTYDVVYNIAELNHESEYKRIDFYQLTNLLFVIEGTTVDDTSVYMLYNMNGEELLNLEDESISYLENINAIVAGDIVYRYTEGGTLEKVKDISASSLRYVLDELLLVNDKIIFLDEDEYIMFYFDKNLTLLNKVPLRTSAQETFIETEEVVGLLANGNIIYQVVTALGDYSPLIDKNDYDFVLENKIFSVSTKLLDSSTMQLKELELPLLLSNAMPLLPDVVGSEQRPFGAEALATGSVFNDKKITLVDGNMYEFFFLFADGSYKTFADLGIPYNLGIINSTRYLIDNTFAISIYDNTGKLIGTLDDYVSYNENYIYDENKVYNLNLEVVYELGENDTIFSNLNDAIMISTYNTEENTYTYSVLTPTQSGPVVVGVSDTSQVYECEYFYYTVAEVLDPETSMATASVISVFKNDTTLIGTYTIGAGEHVSLRYLDNSAVLLSKTPDGQEILIHVYYQATAQ